MTKTKFPIINYNTTRDVNHEVVEADLVNYNIGTLNVILRDLVHLVEDDVNHSKILIVLQNPQSNLYTKYCSSFIQDTENPDSPKLVE